MLKKLMPYLRFDWQEWAKGKMFKVSGVSEWKDYDTKQKLGTRVEVVIVRDDTDYSKVLKNGEQISNAFEKLSFKVPKDVAPAIGSVVEPVNALAKVYGQYNNQLSVKADDVRIIP